jgi:serine/threonine protein kinase
MEYMSGGDLLNLLMDKDVFEEGFAKFYIAEMVLAVQEAHKLGYIHRDIKVSSMATVIRLALTSLLCSPTTLSFLLTGISSSATSG